MALRNQPYIPLYVQDYLTDEKLSECSAAANGVYIRLMCLMHKSEFYGKILLKQKYKQNSKQVLNFASQIAKNLPYDFQTVLKSLEELTTENVLHISGDFLIQKRMVRDNDISEKRAISGKKGGTKSIENIKQFASNFAQAKVQAKSEYETEYENINEIKDIGGTGEKGDLREIFFNDLKTSRHLDTIASDLKVTRSEIENQIELFREKAETEYPTFQKFVFHFKNVCRKNLIEAKNKPVGESKLAGAYNVAKKQEDRLKQKYGTNSNHQQ